MDALPITSKPLDNNPDHLTWEAAWLSEDSRAPMPLSGKSKKITPKSIFITPFLNSYNTSACPPDYKVDYNGKCIQVVSINTADILVTKLQSLFSQHGDGGSNGGGTGEDDYDYDYDSTGPFHVNLPLSIDLPPEPPQPVVSQSPKLTYKDVPGPSFYDSAMVDVTTVDQDKAKITTVLVGGSEKPSTEKPFPATSTTSTPEQAVDLDASSAESSHTDISFLAFETLANGTLVGQVELEGSNSTVVQNIFVSSTTADVPVADAGSTTESTVTGDAGSTGTTADSATDTAGTDGDVLGSTVQTTSQDGPTTTAVDANGSGTTEKDEEESTLTTEVGNPSTTEQDASELENMKVELEEELLLMDSNRSSVAPSDTPTTDLSEMDLDTLPTYETVPSEEPTVASNAPEPVTMSTTVPPPVRPLVPIPTKASVQIITPIKGDWDLGMKGASAHLLAASHRIQQDRTTRATPETTTQAITVERSTEPQSILPVRKDSLEDKKNSAEVDRHEALQAQRDANEANNRFVYHHLPVSTVASPAEYTTEATSTTQSSILQVRPLASTPASSNGGNYLEQLRKINEIVAEKRRHQQQQEQQLGVGSSSGSRIRFPSRDEETLSGAASSNYQQQQTVGGGGVRFPGSASNRLPDIFPKKSPDSTTQRPAFWWLPSGWEVDQTGNKPMLLRFWSRMPLVRDSTVQQQSITTGSGSSDRDAIPEANSNRWRSATGFQQSQQQQQQHGSSHPVPSARGNSKSPSENFYKEVSAQEVYKVMNARQLNQHQQR
uniref:FOG_N domain-containing protein n=1 Tax=Anopheles epiroticus TaxID=199890 RepID=A0A182PLB4_9DIPT